jgi:PspA-Associated protein
MIVRILGEGQFEVADLDALNEMDAALQATVDTDDEYAFADALGRLLDAVHDLGKPVPDDQIGPSALVLPARGTDLAEVRAMLGDEGLIPG